MITEKKRWLTYTWFNRHPKSGLGVAHLYSPVETELAMMVRVPFPTMLVDLRHPDFVTTWSASARTKINRAVREQLTVDRGHYLIPDILRLFSATAVLKGLRGYTPQDLDTLPHLESSAVFYDGVMLCSHIWVIDDQEKRAVLFVNASNHHNENDDASLTGRAHYFLLWQDGLFLQERGIRIMDLMGYDPQTKDTSLKGVYQWKEGTHGQTEMLYHYYPVWFYQARKLRKWIRG
jgi:hypothetical protein